MKKSACQLLHLCACLLSQAWMIKKENEMKILGNVIWLVFGGFESAMAYFASGLAMMLTIIGIPFGIQAFKLGLYVLWPFGFKVVPQEGGHGCLDTLMNIIWFFIGGIWIWLIHVFFGCLLFITIIGIPFARKQFEMAGLAFHPFGSRVVADM